MLSFTASLDDETLLLSEENGFILARNHLSLVESASRWIIDRNYCGKSQNKCINWHEKVSILTLTPQIKWNASQKIRAKLKLKSKEFLMFMNTRAKQHGRREVKEITRMFVFIGLFKRPFFACFAGTRHQFFVRS